MTDRERPLRVGIWCAVSSKRQAESDKISLPEQERLGRAFAAREGAEVVKVYQVPGHTRDIVFWSDAEAVMPAYGDLRRDVAEGVLDVLWGYDMDRLGRDPALGQQVVSLVEKSRAPNLRKAEVYLETAPHPVGQKTVGHRYLNAFHAVRAGEEIERLQHKHESGMRGRARRGLHAGHWPTGYGALYNERGECIGAEFDAYAGAVRLITTLYLRGESYRQMAQALEASPFDPPGGAERWHLPTIRAIVYNDTYAGYVTWGDARNEEPSPYFPAMWDAKTYRAVIRERQRRKEATPHQHSGPLRGVAICARCGKSLHRSKNQYHVYLSCRTGSRRGCHRNYIREDLALQAVVEFLQMLLDDEVLAAALADLRIDGSLVEELPVLQAAIDEVETQRLRCAGAYGQGVMDLEIYAATDAPLRAELVRLRARIEDVQNAIDAQPDLDERQEMLRRLAADLTTGIMELPAGVVATRLRHAGIRVVAEAGEMLVAVVA